MRIGPPVAASVVALAILAAAAWSLRDPNAPAQAVATAVAQSAVDDAGEADTGPAASPQLREYRARQAFERRAREFPRRAAGMGAVARSEEARSLEAELAARERAGEVSAGESMLLRVALVDATAADDAERVRRTAALIEGYRADAQRREAAWSRQLAGDARFNDYKARERAVVAEVMAMPTSPGGLGRDDYLRQRLQREREAAYAANP